MEERDYRSPDGRWTLRFRDPDEFAMGATYWKTQLRRGLRAVRDLPEAMGIGGVFGPFSCDSRSVAYQTVEFGGRPPTLSLAILGVADNRRASRELGSFIWSVQWSPTQLLLLALTSEAATILNQAADVTARIPLASRDDNDVAATLLAGWAPSGDELFVVCPDEAGSTSVTFYDTSGSLLEHEPLDPRNVVPYDEETYAPLRRDYWSLNVAPGTSGVGALLDRWNDARYDAATGELQLAVLRPTGATRDEVVPWGTETVADAEARWVSISFDPT